VSQTFGNFTISGQHNDYFQEDGDSALHGVKAKFDNAVDGHGNIVVSQADTIDGRVEFTKSVGAGLHFIVSGDPLRVSGVVGDVQVDMPSFFTASVEMGACGQVDLVGLPSVTSQSYDGSTLKLYDEPRRVCRRRVGLGQATIAKSFICS